MIYNNLLYFIVAIFLFAITGNTDTPQFPFSIALVIFSGLLFSYDFLARRFFSKNMGKGSAAYFSTEKKLSLLALLFYSAALYFCDIHYYLAPLSLADLLPSLTNIGGLAFFVLFLGLMWRRARPTYEAAFGQSYTTLTFLTICLRTNLPIVLPWILLSLTYDLLALLPFPGLKSFFHSQTGEFFSFIFFLILLLIFFPPLIRRLWGCIPFPHGPLHDHLHNFFKKQQFSAQIYLWPLFEGRVLTAGVMGIIPGLRYVLITPALLEALTLDELDAVMAHEIGHIKRKHMLLYLLIISGFSVLAGFILKPFTFFILSRDSFYLLLKKTGGTPETVITIMMAVITLGLMILYFRYLFGFFIRNFERQADLHVITALGSSHSIISAFEKIAVLSGDTRDLPSWHHFGIGQRVDYLEKCEKNPTWIGHHNRKVLLCLLAYLLVLGTITFGQSLLPSNAWEKSYEEKYTEYIINMKIIQEPEKALWLRLAGDLLQHKKMEEKALDAYEKALLLEPTNPEILNNLAWLLLTSEKLELRDPLRALSLARFAAMREPRGHVLDTLATAYWANNLIKEAVDTEKQAIFVNPEQSEYYRLRIRKFTSTEYETGLPRREEESI
ncbi:MAG: M48 family metalloprotease [Proteobacteria bacterium]|nr:M48 family metalloprotease [Pseudomonadota bacterium]MBU1058949.1 M48 family metalloprotease [Pseudomonadota bacterium]